jgi:hypothetical protein
MDMIAVQIKNAVSNGAALPIFVTFCKPSWQTVMLAQHLQVPFIANTFEKKKGRTSFP